MQRNQLIDTLRGLAMIVMILTHSTVFFLQDKLANFLWNWSHFAVPIFVFCSVYLFLQKSLQKPVQFWPYLKKRVVRLLVPYYYFLVAFILLLLLIKPETVTMKYVLQSIFVIGGVDINWLVLLFFMLTIILPFFTWSFTKKIAIFFTFLALALGSTVGFLFYKPDISYKFIMWLPWSLMLFVTLFYIWYYKARKPLYWLTAGGVITFYLAGIVQTQLHHSTVLIDNKYPPNIYYLSYGITILLTLAVVPQRIIPNIVISVFNFFSKFSYSIYFIHYLILTALATVITQWHFAWYTFFATILLTTVIVQLFINIMAKKITIRKPSA